MIVITGGAGFIGSNLLKKFGDEVGGEILVVDRLGESDKWKNLVGNRIAGFVHKDDFLRNLDDYDGKVEAILHMGACSSTTERDADYLMQNNFGYSVRLAEFALKNEARFIYASSAATYGAGERGYSDREFRNLKPLNMYGFSKQLFDLWVLDRKLDKKFVGFKFFNVFGPNEYHKGDMASMVLKAFDQIGKFGEVNLFRSNVPEYPDGGQMRDFVYVKDAVEVVWNAFRKPEVSGIFNLGTGKPRSWNHLIGATFAALDRETNIEYVDMPKSLEKQYQNYTCADMSKAREAGISIDFRSLEDSVVDYVRNYLREDRKRL